MPVARIVGGIGRVLITAGLVLLLFVAYQLWGTGLAEARAQDDLRDDFAAALAAPPATTPPTTAEPPPDDGRGPTAPTTAPATTTPAAPAPRPPQGEAVAIIRIPRLGLDKAVVEGVTVGDLKKGPGHYPSTPMPGEAGNAAIAGHRTTYGAPFGDLGELVAGDEILVTTRAGEFRYVVDRTSIVSPSQVEVLDPTPEARLTLTTCHPKYTARQRLIVSGVLAGPAPAPAAPAPATDVVPADDVPDDGVPAGEAPADELPADDVPEDGGPDAGVPDDGATETGGTDGEGAVGAGAEGDVGGAAPSSGGATLDDPSLAGDPAARVPAAAWAGVTALVALAAWAIGQRWRRWPAYLLALPLGALALFQCFEQVARLFPANV
jgi:sortase A